MCEGEGESGQYVLCACLKFDMKYVHLSSINVNNRNTVTRKNEYVNAHVVMENVDGRWLQIALCMFLIIHLCMYHLIQVTY